MSDLSFTIELSERLLKNVIASRKIDRQSFLCIKAVVKPQSKFGQFVENECIRIYSRLNSGKANNSTQRTKDDVYNNNLSGLLAELVCYELFKARYGQEVLEEHGTSLVNGGQIDIRLKNGKSIEVRSSNIRNGIDFALFAKSSINDDDQYVDIIGPYVNKYKLSEPVKDYYIRVIYPYSDKQFGELWQNNKSIDLYVTGGVTKAMMNDRNYYRYKSMLPNQNIKKVCSEYETKYKAIPIGMSLDIHDFFRVFEEENGELDVYNSLTENADYEEMICQKCGAKVTKTVFDYSVKNFNGKCFCYNCQRSL